MQKILLTGATGYIGRLMIRRLEAHPHLRLRCLARDAAGLQSMVSPMTEVVAGDVLDLASINRALEGVDTAYYLIHLMSRSKHFEEDDRKAAKNFAEAAARAGVKRIIYLGGLGDDSNPDLSPHLRSRHEVGEILRSSGVEVIEFRCSAIIGRGSLSYDLVRTLTDRLPVMIIPSWLATPTQPIAIDDVLAYLDAARNLSAGESRTFEIGGTDVVTYGDLIRECARVKGLRRWLIPVPLLTPRLSGLWLALVTPTKFTVARHLIEGLRNPTVVRNPKAVEAFPDIHPMNVSEAIRRAERT